MGMFDWLTKPINTLVNGIRKVPDIFDRTVNFIPQTITGLINKAVDIFNKVVDIFNNVVSTFNKVVEIFNCLVAFFDFIGQVCRYIVKFISWLFLNFFPWLAQYIECAFNKIISLPNCFIWYALDTLAFTLYLPFRFLFWLLDTVFNLNSAVQNLEHDCWVMMDSLDEYIHSDKTGKYGPGLGTGFHIIHFPDSVMEKCYKCKIKCLSPMPCLKDLSSAYQKMIKCGSKDVEQLKKCGNSGPNFEKC